MQGENPILCLSFPAEEDLSSDQYRFVVLTSTGTVRRPNSATEVAIGILQNAPGVGEAASVMELGASKLEMNAILAKGSFVSPEYVSATDAGKGQDAAGALQYARAIVLEDSATEDDLATVLLIGPVPSITATAKESATVTTDATAGARTYTAAELYGKLILRDPAGANRADVTPTAAALVAAIPGAIVGSSFEFSIRNTADAAETITLTAGAGITLSGTMTIAQNNGKKFLVVCTNVGSGTEAVTIYSLGTIVW
jgi:hypothetical protein